MWKIFVVVFFIVQAVLSCKSSKNEESNEVDETEVNKGTKNEIKLPLATTKFIENNIFSFI